jgi:Contractile injection system tape measure protein
VSDQRHCIGRQTIELILPGKDDLPLLRQRIGEMYRTLLLQEMERIFSDFSSPEGVTRFDLIELDLGVLPLSDLDAALRDRLGSSLRAELQRRAGQAILLSEEKQSHFPRVQEKGTPLPDVPQFIDGQTLRRELLLHFLDRGTLPW